MSLHLLFGCQTQVLFILGPPRRGHFHQFLFQFLVPLGGLFSNRDFIGTKSIKTLLSSLMTAFKVSSSTLGVTHSYPDII